MNQHILSIRDYNYKVDALPVNRIWQTFHSDDFSIDSPVNSITNGVVHNNDGKLVAFGMVKPYAEAVFVLNLDCTQREKVVALKLLMFKAVSGVHKANLGQLHVSVKDAEFAKKLIRHYGFTEEEGKMLVLEV